MSDATPMRLKDYEAAIDSPAPEAISIFNQKKSEVVKGHLCERHSNRQSSSNLPQTIENSTMYNESQKIPKVKHSFRMPKTTVFLNSQNSNKEGDQLSGADHQVS